MIACVAQDGVVSLENFLSVDAVDDGNVADLGGLVPVVLDLGCLGFGSLDFI